MGDPQTACIFEWEYKDYEYNGPDYLNDSYKIFVCLSSLDAFSIEGLQIRIHNC